MKRFDYDDNEDFQDDPLFNDMQGDEMELTPQQYNEMMQRRDAIELMQIELASLDVRQRLLYKIIKMLERSWWWRFCSTNSKLREISRAYRVATMLVNPPQEEG